MWKAAVPAIGWAAEYITGGAFAAWLWSHGYRGDVRNMMDKDKDTFTKLHNLWLERGDGRDKFESDMAAERIISHHNLVMKYWGEDWTARIAGGNGEAKRPDFRADPVGTSTGDSASRSSLDGGEWEYKTRNGLRAAESLKAMKEAEARRKAKSDAAEARRLEDAAEQRRQRRQERERRRREELPDEEQPPPTEDQNRAARERQRFTDRRRQREWERRRQRQRGLPPTPPTDAAREEYKTKLREWDRRMREREEAEERHREWEKRENTRRERGADDGGLDPEPDVDDEYLPLPVPPPEVEPPQPLPPPNPPGRPPRGPDLPPVPPIGSRKDQPEQNIPYPWGYVRRPWPRTDPAKERFDRAIRERDKYDKEHPGESRDEDGMPVDPPLSRDMPPPRGRPVRPLPPEAPAPGDEDMPPGEWPVFPPGYNHGHTIPGHYNADGKWVPIEREPQQPTPGHYDSRGEWIPDETKPPPSDYRPPSRRDPGTGPYTGDQQPGPGGDPRDRPGFGDVLPGPYYGPWDPATGAAIDDPAPGSQTPSVDVGWLDPNAPRMETDRNPPRASGPDPVTLPVNSPEGNSGGGTGSGGGNEPVGGISGEHLHTSFRLTHHTHAFNIVVR